MQKIEKFDKDNFDKVRRLFDKKSKVCKFREEWLKKGFELVDITNLCNLRLGISGSCNSINEPEDKIYHIQMTYRGEVIATFSAGAAYVIDEDKYVMFKDEEDMCGIDFIIMMKVKK